MNVGTKFSARDRIGRWLLHWRWLAMLLLGLTVTILEMIEHESLGGSVTDRDLLREVVVLGILMPIVIGSCLTVVARMRSEATVIRITTVETERSRLARDLHDTLGQNLGYVRLRLERLGNDDTTLDKAQIQSELRHLSDLVDGTYEQVRGKLVELRPPASPDLASALSDYARVVGRRAHFAVEFHSHGQPRALSEHTQHEVVYFFREALINIEKHAKARCVTIELTWLADGVNISLADDGEGFDPQDVASTDHFGLKIMRERAQEVNGRLTLRSRRFFGTELTLWFPLDTGRSS
jgi:signal transduction histidine kinase